MQDVANVVSMLESLSPLPAVLEDVASWIVGLGVITWAVRWACFQVRTRE
jgi:hypothetical protein